MIITYTYTDTEVRIAPFERLNAYITVHKPYIEGDRRRDARVTWSRFAQQQPMRAYEFAQGLFIAAGLADVFNLIEDIEVVKKFGQ